MLFLSFKQLFSKKKQTLLILLGISFGTMLFISISGIMLGLRGYISDTLLSNTSHILISGAEEKVDREYIETQIFKDNKLIFWETPPLGKKSEAQLNNYQGWVQRLNKSTYVYGYTPRLKINTVAYRGQIKANISLIGTLPKEQLKISKIEDYVKTGSFSDLIGGGNKIMLGTKLAEDLGVQKGQTITLYNKQIATMFKVIGTFKLGDDRIDSVMAYAHLNDVQLLNQTPGRISEVAVSLYDIDMAEELASTWGLYTNDKVEDWKQANKMFLEVINMQDIVRYFITFAVLVVAGFGVYNVLSIMISQKKHEIAILRSIGYGPEKILILVLYQGIFLGIAGGILGMIFGFTLTTIVGSIDLNFELGKSNHLIISYEISTYIIAFIAAIIASIIASYIPAHAASKMTPIDIIRGQA